MREQLLDVFGTVQLTSVQVDTLQRPAQRVHRRALDNACLALATARLGPRTSLAQSPQRLTFALNRRVGAPLHPPAHLVHLVEHMKAVVTLFGVRKHRSGPRRNPARRPSC